MKKLLLILAMLFVFPMGVCADSITLDSVEVLSMPNATHINWFVSKN